MTFKIYLSTKKETINLLTNKHINIKTNKNLIYIIKNLFNINIEKLLINNSIPFKLIK